MVDGAASLMSMFYELRELGFWEGERGTNLLDGGCPFYATYRTADGRYMAVGALEPQFFHVLVSGLEIDRTGKPDQYDRSGWPEMRREFATAFAAKSRDEWSEVFEGVDACVSPVLSMGDAPVYSHNQYRKTFVDVAGSMQPGPAPRFSRSIPEPPRPRPEAGEHTDEILTAIGFVDEEIAGLRSRGVVY